jgi:amidase
MMNIKFMLGMLFILQMFVSCQDPKTGTVEGARAIYEMSVEEIAKAIENKQYTVHQVVEHYIDRINYLDLPDLNSVILINPDALKIADMLDEEISKGKYRGVLHGIPVLIKDNIDTGDGMPNTAGSILFSQNLPNNDAHIIAQLREAGAVLLGKTNLSEWANFRSEASESGWSSVGGQTRNFHDNARTPCGSSSGSAVAVAAGFAPLAIGTETNGSIVCPAAVNGVVGIKPTVGLWSRSGIIPISHTQDTGGPMAKSVKDAAILLSALTSADPNDQATTGAERHPDYTMYCKPGSLQGKRIGVDTSFLHLSTQLGNVFKENIGKLENAGAEIVPVSYRSLMTGIGKFSYDVLLYEFKDGIENYLKNSTLPYRTLDDLIKANEEMKEITMPHFGQEIFVKANEKSSLQSSGYEEALQKAHRDTRKVIIDCFSENKLDAMVGPTLGHAWPIDYTKPGGFNGPASYGDFSRGGFPHITLPMGKIENLPVGISIMGLDFTERELLGIAYDFEQKKL